MRTDIGIAGVLVLCAGLAAAQTVTPRQQPRAQVNIFAPEPHDLYDGHFVI